MKYLIFIITQVLLVSVSIAQEVLPSATPAALGWLEKASGSIPADLPGWSYLLLGFLGTEFAMRVIPTEKAMSWLLLAQKFLHGIAVLCEKISVLLDKVIQNVKVPKK